MNRTVTTIASVLALAIPALADTVVGFEHSINTGNWTFGPPSSFPATGGNPGWYLHPLPMDTYAPQAHTQGTSVFTGDWRAQKVLSVGCDLRTFSTQFIFQREVTLVLSNGADSVYFLGTSFVPQVNEGWKSFDFAINAASTTIPLGWSVLNGAGTPSQVWNNVIQNVTEVRFFYGDPTFFFIFDIWDVGIDNPRIVFQGPWSSIGAGEPGVSGIPVLTGSGPLTAGSTANLDLTNARPLSPAVLFVSTAYSGASLLGGTLVPDPTPPSIILKLQTDAAGAILASGPWPSGVPSGTHLYFQYWIMDAAAQHGASCSNGMLAVAP